MSTEILPFCEALYTKVMLEFSFNEAHVIFAPSWSNRTFPSSPISAFSISAYAGLK